MIFLLGKLSQRQIWFLIYRRIYYTVTRVIVEGHSGGRSGYLAKELANYPFKDTADHFKRDPVVISKGIKGLEKRIGEGEVIITAINMLRESLTKNRKKYSFS